MINLICAVAEDGAIGYQNRLLFRLSDDLKRFKKLTTGHTVLMGRRTFDSLPKGALPNRRNLVLSRNSEFAAPNVEVFPNLKKAIDSCPRDEEIFIIGGAMLYRQAVLIVDRMYLTEIHASPQEADVFFPMVDFSEWTEVSREEHPADEKNEVAFDFVEYVRKKRR